MIKGSVAAPAEEAGWASERPTRRQSYPRLAFAFGGGGLPMAAAQPCDFCYSRSSRERSGLFLHGALH
jgi:hypothetical protein